MEGQISSRGSIGSEGWRATKKDLIEMSKIFNSDKNYSKKLKVMKGGE